MDLDLVRPGGDRVVDEVLDEFLLAAKALRFAVRGRDVAHLGQRQVSLLEALALAGIETPVTPERQLVDTGVGEQRVGDQITLRVWRDGREIEVAVVLQASD